MCLLLFGTIFSFSVTGWSDFGVKEPSVSVGTYGCLCCLQSSCCSRPWISMPCSHISEQILKS